MNVFVTIFSCAASIERSNLSSRHNVCTLVRTLTCKVIKKIVQFIKLPWISKIPKAEFDFLTPPPPPLLDFTGFRLVIIPNRKIIYNP